MNKANNTLEDLGSSIQSYHSQVGGGFCTLSFKNAFFHSLNDSFYFDPFSNEYLGCTKSSGHSSSPSSSITLSLKLLASPKYILIVLEILYLPICLSTVSYLSIAKSNLNTMKTPSIDKYANSLLFLLFQTIGNMEINFYKSNYVF
jgi:hypothetical protein